MRRTPMKRAVIRSLRPGDPIPEGEPKRYKDGRGYVRLRWLVGPQQYIETYEHRIVAGLPTADVHHRDHTKGNNDPANLVVLSREDHASEHGREAAARSRRVTEWEGHRSQAAYDKAQNRKARIAERNAFLARLAELHDAGHTTVEIGQMVDRDPSTVSRALRRAGRAPKARSGSVDGVPRAVRTAVQARAKMCCERCGLSLMWGGGQAHHRRPRAMGGSRLADKHSPANLLWLCYGCHQQVESHRAEALMSGWLVPQGFDPATVAVLVDRGSRWVYLTEDGYADNPPEAVAS